MQLRIAICTTPTTINSSRVWWRSKRVAAMPLSFLRGTFRTPSFRYSKQTTDTFSEWLICSSCIALYSRSSFLSTITVWSRYWHETWGQTSTRWFKVFWTTFPSCRVCRWVDREHSQKTSFLFLTRPHFFLIYLYFIVLYLHRVAQFWQSRCQPFRRRRAGHWCWAVGRITPSGIIYTVAFCYLL